MERCMHMEVSLLYYMQDLLTVRNAAMLSMPSIVTCLAHLNGDLDPRQVRKQ